MCIEHLRERITKNEILRSLIHLDMAQGERQNGADGLEHFLFALGKVILIFRLNKKNAHLFRSESKGYLMSKTGILFLYGLLRCQRWDQAKMPRTDHPRMRT